MRFILHIHAAELQVLDVAVPVLGWPSVSQSASKRGTLAPGPLRISPRQPLVWCSCAVLVSGVIQLAMCFTLHTRAAELQVLDVAVPVLAGPSEPHRCSLTGGPAVAVRAHAGAVAAGTVGAALQARAGLRNIDSDSYASRAHTGAVSQAAPL